ncbi:MAG TPA: SpoIIE family protein phosphatase [Candidatus Angelobacter sp.]|nr:SpoIIE family protein phosphatase [Candidatus Angelobacter sp.]
MAAPATTPSKQASILIDIAGQQRRIEISRSPFTIGRSEEADATISDFRVSRLHAKIVFEGDKYSIQDSGSRHGTFVNGMRCEHARLKNLDEITFGVPGLRVIFQEGPQRDSAASMLLSRFASDSDVSELEKLRLFLEAARSLGGGLVVHDVLRNMLDYALRLTKAERGFVYLREKQRIAMACGVDNKGNQLARDVNVSNSVIQEAMSSAAEFIAGDTSQQIELADRQSIVLNELRTIVAIPLRTEGLSGPAQSEVQGVLYLDSHLATRNLSGVSPDVLRALAAECAAVLESARLMESEQVARQYRQELEIAAAIQRSLSSEASVRCEFAQVTGKTIPCKEVGGDFFDTHISTDAITVIVGDVSGKGISAALLASVIHGMFYAQISGGSGIVNAMLAINHFLCSRVAGQKYATLMAARLQRDGSLEIVNCGHVPAIVASGGSVSQIEDGDLPVGLIAGTHFHAVSTTLPLGARLAILTDGISETEDAEGAEFGLRKLEELLGGNDPVAAIFSAVEEFGGNAEAQDDRTLIVLERLQ